MCAKILPNFLMKLSLLQISLFIRILKRVSSSRCLSSVVSRCSGTPTSGGMYLQWAERLALRWRTPRSSPAAASTSSRPLCRRWRPSAPSALFPASRTSWPAPLVPAPSLLASVPFLMKFTRSCPPLARTHPPGSFDSQCDRVEREKEN